MADPRNHWDGVYGRESADRVSWYRAHLETSLETIREVVDSTSAIIDVGGGTSTLVDDLLDAGHTDIAVLDVSGAALQVARERLGERAEGVTWIEGDVTRVDLPSDRYDVWHDRAVFHFLTEAEDRRAYVERAARSVKPRGHLVIATFSLQGPERCSGLEIVRYDGASLGRELGPAFELERETHRTHVTPKGKDQAFVHCLFRRASQA